MKQAEIQGMSVEELRNQLEQLKKEYDQMQMNHAVTPLENPMLIRKTRRTVARLATELSKRDSQ
jgi:large subunit ribosomal protein L29